MNEKSLPAKPTIVFDTNALISALMYPKSVSAAALIEAVKYFQLCASDETWTELVEVSARTKFAKYWGADDRLQFLAQLATMMNFHEVTTTVTECADATDNKFLALAMDAQARVVVSGDQDLRRMHPYKSIAIISPSEFTSRITSTQASTG